MNFEKKISELNINLPKATDPVGSYVATKFFGKMLFVSGQISIDENGKLEQPFCPTFTDDMRYTSRKRNTKFFKSIFNEFYDFFKRIDYINCHTHFNSNYGSYRRIFIYNTNIFIRWINNKNAK